MAKKNQKMVEEITAMDVDFAQWYTDVVKKAELCSYTSVKGCMAIKPAGYAIWEKMQRALDQMFKDTGHENAYFPLFIPKSYFSKEAHHVEGFAKECAVVTHYRLKNDPEGKGVIVDPDAKLEEELGQLEEEEAAMFMEELGIKETGLARVIRTGYRLLDYITFFTAGPMESRAWTVTRGTPAPQAAGKIHTDLCRGFIRMETVSYEDLVAAGGWAKAQAAGKLRIEGKEYLIQDGDVIHVRFSV